MTTPTVFIGSSKEGLDFARAIRSLLATDAEVTLWNESFEQIGKTFIEVLADSVSQYDFAVLLLTPDDLTTSRGIESFSPRDNVLFELGLFMGKLGRSRTFLVYQTNANIKIPSDLAGLTLAGYQWPRSDENHGAAMGPACDMIRKAVRELGSAAGTSRTQVHQDALFGEDGRAALSALPSAPHWNDRILAHMLTIARMHFGLTADSLLTEVLHEPGDLDDLSFTKYSYRSTFRFSSPGRRRLQLAVEVVPQMAESGRRRRFSSLVPEANRGDGAYPCITLLPACGDKDGAERQLREVEVELRTWTGRQTQEMRVLPYSESTDTFEMGIDSAYKGSCRTFRFDVSLEGPNAALELHVRNLLHTVGAPTIYFQPEVVVMDQWVFKAKGKPGVQLGNAHLFDCQVGVEGWLEARDNHIDLQMEAHAIDVGDRTLKTPVMPWTTVQYAVNHTPNKRRRRG